MCVLLFNDVTRHRLSTCSLNRESYGLIETKISTRRNHEDLHIMVAVCLRLDL